MDELVQLKWNTHHSTFIENLSSLRDKQVYTDVTISCGDQFYPAHRLVLSACSSFFSRALSVASCKSPVILLHGIEQPTLEELLVFMYDGEVTIKRSNLAKLLSAARWLGVTGLESQINRVEDSSEMLNIWTLFNQLLSSSGGSKTPEQVADTLQQIRNSLEQDTSLDTSNMEITNLTNLQSANDPDSQSVISNGSESIEFKPILIEGDPQDLLGTYQMSNINDSDNLRIHADSSSDIHEHFMTVRARSRQNSESNSFEGWDDESILHRRRSLDQLENAMNFEGSEEDSQDIVLHYEGSGSEPEKENVEHEVQRSGKRSLCCKHCKKKFRVRKDLVEHLKIHNFLQNYCVICEKEFSNPQALERHMHHVYHCTLCKFTTPNQKTFSSHTNAHTLEDSPLVDTGEQSESQSLGQDIEENVQESSNKILPSDSVRCLTCSECFSDYQSLINHSNRGCSRLVCKHCGKSFLPSRRKGYLRHLNSHKNRRQMFSCPVCPYITNRKRSLTDHISVHTGEYRFRCSLCNYKCTRNAVLRLHIEKKHMSTV